MYVLGVNVNFVDILMLCVVVRGCYVSSKAGLIAEFFRLLGAVCATFIVLHYYWPLAQFLKDKLFVPENIYEFTAFAIWMSGVSIVFFFVGKGWSTFFNIEPKSTLHKCSGSLLSIGTSYFICGLIFLSLVLLNNGYVLGQVENSLSRFVLGNSSSNVYKICYNVFVGPFFPDEKMSPKIAKTNEESSERERLKR